MKGYKCTVLFLTKAHFEQFPAAIIFNRIYAAASKPRVPSFASHMTDGLRSTPLNSAIDRDTEFTNHFG